MIKIQTSQLTNTIYAGSTRKTKEHEIWTKKEDVTDQVILAVFNWLKHECEKGGTNFYEVKFKNTSGRIIFDNKKESEE